MHFTSFLLALLPLTLAAPARSNRDTSLTKRQSYSGRATFYDVGLGACGGYNVGTDYIVALNTAQYGGGYPGPNCGRSITISANGVTVQATIQDQCPSCDYGSLDLSRSLFQRFASEDKGVFQMSWWYNDGNSQPQPTTKKEEPTSTYTPPPPTSTYTPPTSTWVAPTSTYTPPTSTYVAPTTSTAVAETSSTATSAAAASSAAPSPSAVTSGIVSNGSVLPFAMTTQISNSTATASGSASDPAATDSATPMAELGNLALFNQAVTYLGNIIVVGAGGA